VTILKIVSVLLLLLAGSAAVYQLYGRYFVTYRFTETAAVVSLFGLVPVLRIPYQSIREAYRVPYRRTFTFGFRSFRAGNRIFGDVVVITMKQGFIKEIFLTPDHASTFIREIASRLKSYGGSPEHCR
jgi:hypothetical protein